MFAKSRTQQISKSLEVPSISQGGSTVSSLKSSNASLSSADNRCIIMLSSFEENTPPVVIFPENYYHYSHQYEFNSPRKSGMKKQVSFDDSITDSIEAKFSQLNYKEGLVHHSVLTRQSDSESLTLTTNMSTTMSTMSTGKKPNYRIVIFMWSFSLLFALFDAQIMTPGKKCSVSNEVFTQLGVPSIFMALILPLACGPVLSGSIRRILLGLEQVKVLFRRSPSQISILPPSDTFFPFLLALIHAFTYTINMIVSI